MADHDAQCELFRADLQNGFCGCDLRAKLAATEAQIERWRNVTARRDPDDCAAGIKELYGNWQREKEARATADRERDAAMKDAERWRAYREYRAMPDRDMPKHWQAFRTWGIEAGNDDYSVSQGALDAAIDDAIAGKGAA